MSNFEQAAVELKKRLADGESFASAMAYFNDNFSEVPGFMELGRPKQKPNIVSMVRNAVEEGFDDQLDLTYSKFFYVKALALHHGPCNFGNVMGNIFYFTDIDQGVISLETSEGEEPQFLALREAASEPA